MTDEKIKQQLEGHDGDENSLVTFQTPRGLLEAFDRIIGNKISRSEMLRLLMLEVVNGGITFTETSIILSKHKKEVK